MTANDFVYQDSTYSFRLLMRAIYAHMNPPHSFPFAGGLFDQPRAFLEAVQYFGMGKTLYANQAKATSETMKSLGARK